MDKIADLVEWFKFVGIEISFTNNSSLKKLLTYMTKKKYSHIMLGGGSELHGSFLQAPVTFR